MGRDEREIREVHSTWIDAVNAGDLARLLTLMADDAVFLNPGRSPSYREEFSTNFSAAHQQVRVRCISELEEVAFRWVGVPRRQRGPPLYERASFRLPGLPSPPDPGR